MELENTPERIELRSKAKSVFSRCGLALIVLMLASGVLQVIAGAVMNTMETVPGWLFWLGNFLPIYAVGVPLAIVLMKQLPDYEAGPARFTGADLLRAIIICIPVMYIGNIIGTVLSSLLSGGAAQNPLESLIASDSWLRILFMVFVGPFFEELIFRRYLIGKTARYGEKNAIIFSALMFGLFHMNLFQFFYAFALGLIFGYVYVRSGKLIYTVIMHVFINFIGSVVGPWVINMMDMEALEAVENGADPATVITEANMGGFVAYFVYLIALLVLIVVGLILLLKARKNVTFRRPEEELQKGEAAPATYGNAGVIVFMVLCALAMVAAIVSPFLGSLEQ